MVDVVHADHARIGVQLFGCTGRADEDPTVDATGLLGITGDDHDVVAHLFAHLLQLPAKCLRIEVLGPPQVGGFDLEMDDPIWHSALYTPTRRGFLPAGR